MNELQIFNNPKFGDIRTANVDGSIYFVARDVARALGYKDTTNAIKLHCRGVVKHHLIDSIGRKQVANIIPEGDIYRLITHSKLPSAQKFEKWIFDEVLPTIRKTGKYSVKPEQQTLEPSFIPAVRTYRGRRVVTIKDIMKATNKSEGTIQYALHSRKVKCKEGTDYHVLKGDELRHFKKENNLYVNYGVLMVVLESGFVKLCKHFGILPNSTGCFLVTEKPKEKLPESKTTPSKLAPQFNKVKRALIALDVSLAVHERACNRQTIESLQTLAINVMCEVTNLLRTNDQLQTQS